MWVREEGNDPERSAPNQPLLVSYSPHSPSQPLEVKAYPGHKEQGEEVGADWVGEQGALQETGTGAQVRGTAGTGPQSSQPVRRH